MADLKSSCFVSIDKIERVGKFHLSVGRIILMTSLLRFLQNRFSRKSRFFNKEFNFIDFCSRPYRKVSKANKSRTLLRYYDMISLLISDANQQNSTRHPYLDVRDT